MAPSWLNKELLLHALNGNSGNDFDLLSYQIIPSGIPIGNNFGSLIHKTIVRYRGRDGEDREQTFFIKSPLEEGCLLKMVREGKWVEKECGIYEQLIPLMEKMVGTLEFIPKIFPSNRKYTLILEDLTYQGYVMDDKRIQYDFEKSSLVLKAIATFHAASIAVHKINPTLVESLGDPHLKAEHTDSKELVKPTINRFAHVVEKWTGFERFGNLTRQCFDSFWERTVKAFNRRQNMNVLNLGDLWTNNILFKYDKGGQVQNLKLIDFQLAAFGSVGIDLQFFIWSCIKPSVREHRLNELFSIYLKTLNQFLERFGCKERMSAERLDEELDFTMYFGFHTVYFCYYVQLSGLPNDETSIRKTCESQCFLDNSKQALLYFESKELFNN